MNHLGDYENRPPCACWGGGDGTITCCAGSAVHMIEVGAIEEILLHEGAHVNLDSIVYGLADRKCARDFDKHYISVYAKDNPLRWGYLEDAIHLYQYIFMLNEY